MKIIRFLKSNIIFLKNNINSILLGLTSIYLVGLVLSNLFLITQTTNYFEAGKYALSTLLALMVIVLIKLSKDNK